MNCAQARRLFAACWDDETTQAERELLESHFAGCVNCRTRYDEYSRTLEIAAKLPRVEPGPEFTERVLARVRRQSSAPDRVPRAAARWLPLTAAASALAIAGLLAAPWLGPGSNDGVARLERVPATAPTAVPTDAPSAPAEDPVAAATPAEPTLAASAADDSLFNHAEDVEFILDPVVLRRGRASMAQPPVGVQAEQAVISF